MSPINLLQELVDGSIKSEDLSYDQAEEILYLVSKNRILQSFPNSDVKRYKKGPIDVIVESRIQTPDLISGFSSSRYLIYIECKQRKRELELDETAKVYLVAIKDNPNELILISKSGISKQASVYASHFFDVGPSKGVFDHIKFRVSSINELIGLSESEQDSDHRLIPEIAIYQSNNGSEMKIYDSNINFVKATFHTSRDSYKLEVTIPELYGVYCESIDSKVDLKPITNSSSWNSNKSYYQIDYDLLEKVNSDKGSLYAKTGFENRLALPISINLKPDALCHFEINSKNWGNFENEIEFASPELIFVKGEAGVGKTTFCERVINKYQLKEYRVIQFTINRYTSQEIIFGILWQLIWPTGEPPNEKGAFAVSTDLIRESIYQLIGRGGESDAIVDSIINKNVSSETSIYHILIIARLVARLPHSSLIYIRDAHYLSPELLRALSNLIHRIKDDGSSGMTLLFESRSYATSEFLYWDEFINEITSDAKLRALEFQLEECTLSDLTGALSKVTNQVDSQELAIHLYQKCGGNPLFIDQILRYFLITNVIAKGEHGEFYIDDWVALQDRIKSVPHKIERALERSTLLFFSELQKKDQQDDLIKELLVHLYFNFSNEEKPIVTNDLLVSSILEEVLLMFGFLNKSITESHVVFSHELIEDSLRAVLTKEEGFRQLSEKIFVEFFPTSCLGLLSLGNLMKDSKHFRQSFLCFDKASIKASEMSNFLLERKALQGCYELMSHDRQTDAQTLRKTFHIGLKLSGVEIQAGSQIWAKKLLSDLNDLHLRLNNSYHTEEANLMASELLMNKLVLSTRLMEPHVFCESFENYFDIADHLVKIKSGLLTRLLLICCHSSNPALAHQVAKVILSKLGYNSTAIDESSFNADVGRIFLQSNPKAAIKYWEKGARINSSKRQAAHNQLNLLVGNLLAFNRWHEPPPSLLNTLEGLKVENLFIRHSLYKSLKSFINQDWDQAIFDTMLILERTKKVNQRFWMWKCHNNLAVAFRMKGNIRSCADHMERARILLTPLIQFSQSKRFHLEKLVSKLDDKQTIGLEEPIPEVSGAFLIHVHNYEKLHMKRIAHHRLNLEKLNVPEKMIVKSDNGLSLMLAIE